MSALLALVASTAGAQQQRAASPEEVARAVLRADSAGDWVALLRLAHPEALVQFRALQAFQLRMLGVSDGEGLDAFEGDSAGRANWQDDRAKHQRFLLDSVFRVPTVDSLAHTSPDSVFARWVRHVRTTAPHDTATVRAKPEAGYRVVGAVRARDTLAYVVLERRLEQPLGPIPELFRDYPRETHQTEVMVIRRYGREWRSLLDPLTYSYGYVASPEHME